MTKLVELGAAAAHAVLGAVWVGAMAYSLAVVQPRSRRLLGAQRYEDLAATLAAGARWRVLALIAALALTGLALAGLRGPGASWTWTALVVAKAALTVAAAGVFAWVSWRLWPQRLFASGEKLPVVHRRFALAATALLALAGAAFVLGVVAARV